YIFSSTEFNRRSLINDPARSNMNYIDAGGGGGRGGRGGKSAEGGGRAGGGGERGGRGGNSEEGGGPAGGGPGAAAGSAPVGGRGRAGGAGADAAPPLTAFGLPLIKPPYGRVTAINMNTGDHVWMAPIGGTPENIKNHKMLQGVNIPKYTGRAGRTGIMVTKTLLFA